MFTLFKTIIINFVFISENLNVKMCTIIVTIRSVLWAVMTIAGSLMILVSLFTDRWLIGGFQVPTNSQSISNLAINALDKFNDFTHGRKVDEKIVAGIFLDCIKPEGGLVR